MRLVVINVFVIF